MDSFLIGYFTGAAVLMVGLAVGQLFEPKPENCQPIAISAQHSDGTQSVRRGQRCDLWSDE